MRSIIMSSSLWGLLLSLLLAGPAWADGLGPGLGIIIYGIFVIIAVAGVLLAVGLIAAIVWYLRRRRR